MSNQTEQARNEKIEAARERLNQKKKAYSQAFAKGNGQTVLKDLEREFFHRPSIIPGDPYLTHANEGAREVILYIHQMINGD